MTSICGLGRRISKNSTRACILIAKGPAAAVTEKPAAAAAAINMTNKYLTLAMLVAALHATGQKGRQDTATHRADSPYKKQMVSRTRIQVLFAYYTQDGDHSAITGGKGTEWLHVYSPEFTITHQPDSNRTLSLNGGIDIITSASMNMISLMRSSASRVSDRFYLSPGYSYRLPKTHTRLGINTGFSIESAYLSFPAGLSVAPASSSEYREISASLQCYFDDLRFGRFTDTYPLTLVYPIELRDTSWFSIYRRYSYNFDLSFYQVINSKLQFALFPEVVLQKGLLSTPYHRVYFDDNHTERVENLPTERWKFPLGAQLNYFAGRRVIIRFYYRYYHDNWGIIAHTFQLEVPVKINPTLTLAPLARFSTETAAWYFKPYKEHSLAERYYTSNYELSGFNSYKAGLTLRYAPHDAMGRHYFFDALTLRYSYYKRSDGLAGNILSLMLEVGHVQPSSHP